MLSRRDLTARDILEEAFKKLLPATGYLISPRAGFVASVVVLTTWLIKRSRVKRYIDVEDDEKVIAKLLAEIEKLEAQISALEKARESAKNLELVETTITAKKEALEALYKELELRQLRLEAVKKLKTIGDEKLLREVEDLVRRIREGREFGENQYRVLKSLEEKWAKKELEAKVLRTILSGVE